MDKVLQQDMHAFRAILLSSLQEGTYPMKIFKLAKNAYVVHTKSVKIAQGPIFEP